MESEIKKILENFYNNFHKEHISNKYLYSGSKITNTFLKGHDRLTDFLKNLHKENTILFIVGGRGSYIIFSPKYFFVLEVPAFSEIKIKKFSINQMDYLEWKPETGFFNLGQILVKGNKECTHDIKDEYLNGIIVKLQKEYYPIRLKIEEIIKVEKQRKLKEFAESERLKKQLQKDVKIKLENSKVSSINNVDKDNDGKVDLVDGESFNKLLSKNQKNIIEIDKNYIQKFVKISVYLKTKKSNTQLIFESIRETRNEKELDELMSLLKNQIHTYELLVFHSISLITSLVESDLITFYEIYESFDQLGVFNSNWENEVSNKLSDIGDGIKDLMYSINKMEYNIVNSLETLNYTTQESFSELNSSISSQLSSIDSSINFNNLLTGIQTYQMYKINQNTKRIN
jgi:hypothetical protein